MKNRKVLPLGTAGNLTEYDKRIFNSMRNLVSYREHIKSLAYLNAIDLKDHSRFIHRVDQLENIFGFRPTELN